MRKKHCSYNVEMNWCETRFEFVTRACGVVCRSSSRSMWLDEYQTAKRKGIPIEKFKPPHKKERKIHRLILACELNFDSTRKPFWIAFADWNRPWLFFSFLWNLGFYLRNNSRGHSFMICCIDVSLPRVILPVPQKKKFWPCSNTQLCCVSFVQFTNVNDRQWDPAIYSPSLNDSVNTNSWNDPWNKLNKSILTV